MAKKPYEPTQTRRHKDKRSTDNYYHAFSDRLLEVVQKNDNVVELKKTDESE